MSQNILNVAADFSQALNAQVVAGATTATLDSIEDTAGNNLANGYWGFTIDGDNQYKEYIVATLTGTALTSIISISPQGAATTGFSNYHRKGAPVEITDWAALYRVVSVLNGTLNLDGGIPLAYDSTPALGSSNQLATVQYVLDHVNGGAVSLNAEIVAGMAGETLTIGQWVYLKESDGRWYKTDATSTTKCLGVRVGKALGAGTAGNAIAGGVFLNGLETTGTYAPFTTYYLSDTPGALGTSAGTNSVSVGFADGNSKLVVGMLRTSNIDAAAGGGAQGTPSASNVFVTETGVVQSGVFSMTAGATITGATLPVPVYQDTATGKVLACDGNDTAKLKFMGFAVSNSTNGNPINVRTTGIVGGFSGLSVGLKYFVQDAVGTIGTSIGTYAVFVGEAVSATQLFIITSPQIRSGVITIGTSTTVTTLTTGFKPKVVRLSTLSVINGTASIAVANGSFCDGVLNGMSAIMTGTTALTSIGSSNLIVFDASTPGSNLMTVTVGNLTETTFDITYTETGTYNDTGYIFWEAESF